MPSYISPSALSYRARGEAARDKILQLLAAENLETSEIGPADVVLQKWTLFGSLLILSREIVKIK